MASPARRRHRPRGAGRPIAAAQSSAELEADPRRLPRPPGRAHPAPALARHARRPRSGRRWAPRPTRPSASSRRLLDARLADDARGASAQAERRRPRLDLTLPGRRPPRGAAPSADARARRDRRRSSRGLGFAVAEGPEIEDDYHNFEALNIPARPPGARHAGHVLRRRRARCCARTPRRCRSASMQTQKPPLRVIVPGARLPPRRDDATHSPMFHQVEGLLVDRAHHLRPT